MLKTLLARDQLCMFIALNLMMAKYLHEVCSPSLVHKNIKSANILHDMELNPHLSDSGLASLIDDADQALNHNTGSGYGAPEGYMYGQCTIKSDVYKLLCWNFLSDENLLIVRDQDQNNL